jgi:hypothetical protein
MPTAAGDMADARRAVQALERYIECRGGSLRASDVQYFCREVPELAYLLQGKKGTLTTFIKGWPSVFHLSEEGTPSRPYMVIRLRAKKSNGLEPLASKACAQAASAPHTTALASVPAPAAAAVATSGLEPATAALTATNEPQLLAAEALAYFIYQSGVMLPASDIHLFYAAQPVLALCIKGSAKRFVLSWPQLFNVTVGDTVDKVYFSLVNTDIRDLKSTLASRKRASLPVARCSTLSQGQQQSSTLAAATTAPVSVHCSGVKQQRLREAGADGIHYSDPMSNNSTVAQAFDLMSEASHDSFHSAESFVMLDELDDLPAAATAEPTPEVAAAAAEQAPPPQPLLAQLQKEMLCLQLADLEAFLAVLHPALRVGMLAAAEHCATLRDVTVDLGCPVRAYCSQPDQRASLPQVIVTQEHLTHSLSALGAAAFGHDDRAGITDTLHR